MDQMNEYFGEIITKLKQAKDSEKIHFSESFKHDLRKKLIAKAEADLERKFDVVEFFQKWKYVVGFVPTFAVLVIVAVNFSQLKLFFKGNQVVPVSSQGASNQNQSDNTSGTAEQVSLRTFPGYLVMPPENNLATTVPKAENNKTSTPTNQSQSKPKNTSNGAQPAPASPDQKVSGSGEISPNTQATENVNSLEKTDANTSFSNSDTSDSLSQDTSSLSRNSDSTASSSESKTTAPSASPATGDTQAKSSETSSTPDSSTSTNGSSNGSSQETPQQKPLTLSWHNGEFGYFDENGNKLPGPGTDSSTPPLSSTAPSEFGTSPSSVSLTFDRVYFNNNFTSVEKELIYRMISSEFTRRSVSLTSGYFVQVTLSDNNQIKASLFQNNQLQLTLTLEKRGDSYEVL